MLWVVNLRASIQIFKHHMSTFLGNSINRCLNVCAYLQRHNTRIYNTEV